MAETSLAVAFGFLVLRVCHEKKWHGLALAQFRGENPRLRRSRLPGQARLTRFHHAVTRSHCPQVAFSFRDGKKATLNSSTKGK